MRSFEKIVRDIATELKAAALRTEEKIMAEFPPLLSYHLLTGRKYYLTHDFDPPWDCSGKLFTESPDDIFHIDDYEKVGDFFKEYTGNTIASFISGRGFFHETYEKYYRDWMEEQYRSAHFDVFGEWDDDELWLLAKNIFDEDFSGQADDIDLHFLPVDLCEEMEEFEDLSTLYACDLLLKLSEMDIILVYKLGENQAKERINLVQLEMEQRKKEIELEKAAFNKLWSLLEKKYRLIYQKPFPKRIEMPDFQPFKQFLDNYHVQHQERVLISKYAPISFSNSVTGKLRTK